jgi:DNA polymerase-3 subunit delta'
MFFKDIVGQEEVKTQLRHQLESGRIPHAQLFAGPAGTGKLPMAVAFARYLVCGGVNKSTTQTVNQPAAESSFGFAGFFDDPELAVDTSASVVDLTDSCGHCPACVKMNKLVHPDVHFMMPVFKRDSGRNADTYPQSDDFIYDFRDALLANPYLELGEWMHAAGAENQQGELYAAQANELIRKLSFRSSEGGRRVVIVWMPERMNESCANKLLKLIEEPPAETVILMVSDDAERVLPTIQSRTLRINFRPLAEPEIAQALTERYSLGADVAAELAHTAGGSWARAMHLLDAEDDTRLYTDLFIRLMRLAYGRKLKELKDWSDEVAKIGRASQREFLTYAQRMTRESFVANFRTPALNYMNSDEAAFTARFAPFVDEHNIMGITELLSDAQRDIEGNVNAKMVFFDLSLRMIILLRQSAAAR